MPGECLADFLALIIDQIQNGLEEKRRYIEGKNEGTQRLAAIAEILILENCC